MKLATTAQITNSSLLFKRVAVTEVTAFCKKQTTLEDRIASDTSYLHKIQTTRKFANASNEPHYAVAKTHLIFYTFARWFCKTIGDFVLCMSCKRY